MSTPHDQQPQTGKKDMSVEDLQFLHAAPSHERTETSGRRRNLLLGGGAITGVAGLIAAGVFTLGGGNNDPTERNDRVDAGTSHSAEPTPSPEVTPTPEVELVELGYVTKAEYPKPVDALIALEERRLAFISGTLEPSFEEWDKANPTLTFDDYLNVQLATVFGEGFDPNDPMVKSALDLFWHFDMVNGDLRFAHEAGSIDNMQYVLTLGKDTEILGVNGTRITYIPDFDTYAVDPSSSSGEKVEVPIDYRDETIESMPERGTYESTSVLAEEDDHWIIVE